MMSFVKKLFLGVVLLLALGTIFMLYRDPNFMLEVADQVWNCF